MSYFVMLHMNMHHFRTKFSKGLLGSDGDHGAGKWKFFSLINKIEIYFRLRKLFLKDDLKFPHLKEHKFCY